MFYDAFLVSFAIINTMKKDNKALSTDVKMLQDLLLEARALLEEKKEIILEKIK